MSRIHRIDFFFEQLEDDLALTLAMTVFYRRSVVRGNGPVIESRAAAPVLRRKTVRGYPAEHKHAHIVNIFYYIFIFLI